jgi:hypothetical protein
MKDVKIMLIAMAMMASTFVFGQFNLGLKTGLSVSDAQTELYIDAADRAPKSYTSFLVGATAEIQINRNFSFQPELQYVKRGFTINEGTSFEVVGFDIPVGAKATTIINYIEAPLLAKAKIGNGTTNFYGIVGPSIGYATSAKIQPKVTLLIDFNLPEVDLNLNNDIYNRTEISGVIGAGIEHNVQTGKLIADVRYSRSFTNIINDPIVDISVKNSGVQLSVGYAYQF